MTWALGLLGVLVPAVVLLALVARCAKRLAPGTGTAVAITLGAGTLVLPFSTLYFSHILSALLCSRRSRSSGASVSAIASDRARGCSRSRACSAGSRSSASTRWRSLARSSAIYALTPRKPGRVRRALAYGGGVAAGIAPLLAYQWWAFGSPLHLAYANAVAKTGFSGHDELGLNDGGFFGITVPRPLDALELLFSGRGLLTLAPVLVMAIAGVVALHRERRHRAEANVIIAIALAYFVYNAGYWLPLGGGSPGPRFSSRCCRSSASAWRWPGAAGRR